MIRPIPTFATVLITVPMLVLSPTRGDEPKAAKPVDGPKAAKDGDAPAFPPGDAAELGIDKAALERLRKRATEADSDALVVVKDGRLVADWDFGREKGPIEAMSATKSIVNLAIGRLIDQGKIKSLDQPICDFYKEWKQGRKQRITVRHLLNHTSGLQDNRITSEIYPSPDFVQLALTAELTDDPGSKFFYNNKAVNLLAGVVQRASGTRMDLYIGKEIFEPMGIKDFGWSRDPAGNPHGLAGLQIRALDLARIGQMMLDEGTWEGRQIVSKEWVRESVKPGQSLNPTCGLLWWVFTGPQRYAVDDGLIKLLKDHGMTPQSLEKLEALKGKPMAAETFWTALRPILHRDEVISKKLLELDKDLRFLKPSVRGPSRGYSAQGYLGQYLVVIPRHRLVAVRQRRYRDGTNPEDPKTNIGEFDEMVDALVPDKPEKPRP